MKHNNRYVIAGMVLLALVACGRTAERSGREEAVALELNNRGVELAAHFNDDSIVKAIQLFDEATRVQPDFYLAHWNKFVYQLHLGLKDDAWKTLQALAALQPGNADLKVTMGIFLENRGDSLEARKSYLEADALYLSILDTLQPHADPHHSVQTNRAMNLKLLGRADEGNALLDQVLAGKTDRAEQDMIRSFRNMRREELLSIHKNGSAAIRPVQ